MARPIEQNMGGAAMRAATGRDHDAWRRLLTEAGALSWSHAEIANWLVATHEVSGWWAQGITVDFEQACKGRLPGQQADGTFSVARTVTIAGDRLAALSAVASEISRQYGEPHGQNLAASQPVVRWRLTDGTRLQAVAQPPNKSGTPVNITWAKLPDGAALENAKALLAVIFANAATGIGGGSGRDQ